MDMMPPLILHRIARWPDTAQNHLVAIRRIAHDVADAAETGPLEESLKWGQPAWRPHNSRTGSTLRLNWSPAAPDRLMAFVDCKTDLAAQMSTRFPGRFHNDCRRALAFDLVEPLPEDAIWQLALLTFTYHRTKSRA
jgi:hypothetical protein